MIKAINRDVFSLRQKSTPATLMDMQVAQDLIDTLNAHKEHCVGMAANMIGVFKNIIIFRENHINVIMFNPKIIKTSGRIFECEEGCLSLHGERITKRYEKIKVEYEDYNFKKKIKTYEGFTAQIIQHEIDHCNGIII